MPRSTRRKKPTAAELATVLRVLEEIAPPEVTRRITQSVFPRNAQISSGISQTRDTINRARELYARAVRARQLQHPGWSGTWNNMVGHLNTARDQLWATARLAQSKNLANMLKGKRGDFSRKALDFYPAAAQKHGRLWPSPYIDTLQQRSEELAALTGIPEEDIEWSRAADWADNLAGKRRTRRRRHRNRSGTRKRFHRKRSQRKR